VGGRGQGKSVPFNLCVYSVERGEERQGTTRRKEENCNVSGDLYSYLARERKRGGGGEKVHGVTLTTTPSAEA